MKPSAQLSCFLLLALVPRPAVAQTGIDHPVRRHCNTEPPPPLFSLAELGDSAAFVLALRLSADTTEPMVAVSVTYRTDGTVAKVKTLGASSHAAAQLEQTFQSHLRPLGPVPKHYVLGIGRLNQNNEVEVFPAVFTCPAESVPRTETDSVSRRFLTTVEKNVYYYTHMTRPAVVRLWVEASGEVQAVWLEQSSNDAPLDSIALQLAATTKVLPPLVGSRSVPAVLEFPVLVKGVRDPTFDLQLRGFP